jgi:hypothetical protein
MIMSSVVLFMLDQALHELQELLDGVESPAVATNSSVWQERMERREEAWEAHRPAIYERAMMHSYMPHEAVCSSIGKDMACKSYFYNIIMSNVYFLHTMQRCQMCSAKACLRCLDCGPGVLLCVLCDDRVHFSSPCHDREVWLEDHFHPLSPRESVDDQGSIIAQGRLSLNC